MHGRATPAQQTAISAALVADGVAPDQILWARDGKIGGRVPHDTVILAVERAIAIAPECPGFIGHPAAPEDNLAEPNLGCANIYNFAAMVTDPHHIYRGASSIYYLGERGTADVAAYRADKVKQLPRINEGFAVGAGNAGAGGQ